jgi:hypothetical protein
MLKVVKLNVCYTEQEILTEGEGSVRFTSLYFSLDQIIFY